MIFLYLMKNIKQLNEQIIKEHVEFLKELNFKKKLLLCGPFMDYPGGVVIFNALDNAEANNIANQDPYIKYGFKTFKLRALEVANEENNYLL